MPTSALTMAWHLAAAPKKSPRTTPCCLNTIRFYRDGAVHACLFFHCRSEWRVERRGCRRQNRRQWPSRVADHERSGVAGVGVDIGEAQQVGAPRLGKAVVFKAGPCAASESKAAPRGWSQSGRCRPHRQE
uniref:Uncharacterized protein n=1 Tax=Arundo donax TaxID=35708 RepID=A0A0A9CRX0_ARUDO